jgi:hypothetical protein
MIEVDTALGWRRTIRHVVSGDITAQELIDHAELIAGTKELDVMTKGALIAMALVLTDDAWELLGKRSPLGKPAGVSAQREDGAYERPYESGLAVFVPGYQNNVAIDFEQPHHRGTLDEPAETHFVVRSPGGEMFLRSNEDSTLDS